MSLIAFSILSSSLALKGKKQIIAKKNFLQSSLKEKNTKTDSNLKSEIKEGEACAPYKGNYGSGCYGGGANCGLGYGDDNYRRDFYPVGNYGSGYGYGKGLKNRGKYFGRGVGCGGYGARDGAYADGFYDSGCGYGSGCGSGYGVGSGYGAGSGYGVGYGYGDELEDGFYDSDENYGFGPSHRAGYTNGRGHYKARDDLRGKYISLEDAAALLGCASERKIAQQNAYKDDAIINTDDSGSKYLDKNLKNNRKFCRENSCDDEKCDSAKDFSSRKCNRANKDAYNKDKKSTITKKHNKLNCRNKKNEALCMNTNHFDKNCTDGKLFQEFDKLEHFKKCEKDHKENESGNDCSVKKRNDLHNCQDSHVLDFNNDRKDAANENTESADNKESVDYHCHDRRNKNARNDKVAKECDLANDLTKAAKFESEKDAECNRANSNACATAKRDAILKQVNEKEAKEACVDAIKCLDKAICNEKSAQSCENPPVC